MATGLPWLLKTSDGSLSSCAVSLLWASPRVSGVVGYGPGWRETMTTQDRRMLGGTIAGVWTEFPHLRVGRRLRFPLSPGQNLHGCTQARRYEGEHTLVCAVSPLPVCLLEIEPYCV